MDLGHKGLSPKSWMVSGKRVEKGVEIESTKRECVRLKEGGTFEGGGGEE